MGQVGAGVFFATMKIQRYCHVVSMLPGMQRHSITGSVVRSERRSCRPIRAARSSSAAIRPTRSWPNRSFRASTLSSAISWMRSSATCRLHGLNPPGMQIDMRPARRYGWARLISRRRCSATSAHVSATCLPVNSESPASESGLIYRLELRAQDVELLLKACASANDLSSSIGPAGVTHAVLSTRGYATLEQWRLFLNREGRPYRYCEWDGHVTRELGRSRSPDWA